MLDMQIYCAYACVMHVLVPINIDAMLPKKLKRLTDTVERINILKFIF